jgi:hypothetical protein
MAEKLVRLQKEGVPNLSNEKAVMKATAAANAMRDRDMPINDFQAKEWNEYFQKVKTILLSYL